KVVPIARLVSVLSLLQVLLHNPGESWVCKEVPCKTIQGRSVARNRCGNHHATGSEHPVYLPEGTQPFCRLGEGIQRPQEHHPVRAPIAERQFPGVPHLTSTDPIR